jgi:hypothetical protein
MVLTVEVKDGKQQILITVLDQNVQKVIIVRAIVRFQQ